VAESVQSGQQESSLPEELEEKLVINEVSKRLQIVIPELEKSKASRSKASESQENKTSGDHEFSLNADLIG
jgi:hypothetical protein